MQINKLLGYGTKGHSWFSGNGNIATTIILKPQNCPVHTLEGLTLLIAKCMVDAIYKLYGITLTIKHPNDLMLNGKKIGGILTR